MIDDRPLVDEHGRRQFHLEAGTVSCSFMLSNNFVDIICGPVGSSKTSTCCARIMRHAQQQRPSKFDNLRKSRWAIVRNVYPDLKRSTIRTWLDLFPEHTYGKMNWSIPPSHRIKFNDILLEVDFLALDKPENVSKLRSAEYTGIWFNEVQYIEKVLFDEGTSRVGRYPSRQEGGTEWRGVIADMNAPDEDHWLAMMTGMVDFPPGMTEEERKEHTWPGETEHGEWGFWKQPPAVLERLDENNRLIGYEVNPNAENLRWLEEGYYLRQLGGKKKSWIDSRLRVIVTLVVEGSPVWPMFKLDTHVATEPLRPVPGHDVVVGLDFGLNPAACFMQAINERVYVQYELACGLNEGSVGFAPRVKRFLTEHYPDYSFRIFGDPKGQDRPQTGERTPYEIFAANGLKVTPAPGLKQNDITTRVEAVAYLLNEMYDGRPRFVLSPMARTLKVGMAGRYHNTKDEVGDLKPKKDKYADFCDSLQYGVLGLGEGRRLIGLKPLSEVRSVQIYKGRRSMRRVVA